MRELVLAVVLVIGAGMVGGMAGCETRQSTFKGMKPPNSSPNQTPMNDVTGRPRQNSMETGSGIRY